MRFWWLLLFLLLVHCASKQTVRVKKADQDDRIRYVQKEDGSYAPNKRKASEYDSMREDAFSKDYKGGGNYLSKRYKTNRWNRRKEFEKVKYSNGEVTKQFKDSPFFVKQFRKSQKIASAQEKTYAAGNYKTQEANYKKTFSNPSEQQSKIANKRHKAIVLEQKEYQQLTVKQTKTLLGKD